MKSIGCRTLWGQRIRSNLVDIFLPQRFSADSRRGRNAQTLPWKAVTIPAICPDYQQVTVPVRRGIGGLKNWN
jgi:hypothetical protein